MNIEFSGETLGAARHRHRPCQAAERSRFCRRCTGYRQVWRAVLQGSGSDAAAAGGLRHAVRDARNQCRSRALYGARPAGSDGAFQHQSRDGKPIGLGDAGQGWHTDMSYSKEIAFGNVLFALENTPARWQGAWRYGFCQHACRLRRSAGRPEDEARGPRGDPRLREILGDDAVAAWFHARAPDSGAARQEATGRASDFHDAPDHGQEASLLQSRLRDEYCRHGCRRKATRRWPSCSNTSSRKSTSSRITGAKAMCCSGRTSARSTTRSPTMARTSRATFSDAR